MRFSRAMTARGVHRHVRLIGPGGDEVPLAFVEVEEGLWDPGQTRLTLFFHPGRVKRAVAPGEALGPPLRAGRDYRLVIDGALTDTAAVPMGAAYERRFRVAAADRTSPRAADIHVQPPWSARGPAVVTLPEPLDEALLRRWLWVEDAQGHAVAGRAEVGEGETRWSFVPDAAWTAGRHAVRLRAGLEDRAGNRFDRLFDRARLDTGPIVAFLKADDVHHAWAIETWARLRPPLLTCEPVLSEAVYLLSRLDKGAATVFELVRRGVVKLAFRLDAEIDSVSRVVAKYGPRRTDLADACLVRMSELHVDSTVLTVDSQFRDVYRHNGRRVIETLMPEGVSGRRKRGS